MAVDDVYQVNIRYNFNSQECLTSLHFVVTEDVGAGDVEKEQALADYIANTANPADFMSQLVDLLPADCRVNIVTAQLVFPVRLSYRSSLVGAFGTSSISNNQAQDVLITKRTDFAGRDQVGHIHMPGIPQDEMAAGMIQVAYKDDVLDCWEELVGPITIAGTKYEFCLLHAPALEGITSIVSNLIVQDQCRVMQRRVVGRGI